jgi:hypothetical protein
MDKTEMHNNVATPRGQTEGVLRELGWSTNTCREVPFRLGNPKARA